MRPSSLLSTSLSLCLASVAMAQTSQMSDELRQEIRNLIREEVHAALKQVHGQLDKAPVTTTDGKKPATSFGFSTPEQLKLRWTNQTQEGSKEGKKVSAFTFVSPDGTPTDKTAAKAFRMVDGKLEPVKLETVKHGDLSAGVTVLGNADSKHSFEVVKTGSGKHDVTVVREPKAGSRMMVLTPTENRGADRKFELVLGEKAETTALVETSKALEAANECCEAVKAAKGETECCEEGKCPACVVEVEAAPSKIKVKKADKKKSEKKAKKAKGEKIDEVTELKISDVLEKLSR